MKRVLVRAVAVSCLALAACGKSDGGVSPSPLPSPPPALPPSAASLSILGKGAIGGRYTAEVAVRGTVAYTSTWGSRGGNVGNVIYIWDVAASAPRLVDSLVVEGATTTGDVQVSDDGRLLVVATERQNGSIAVYDLAVPASPRLLARFSSQDTFNGVHTAKVARVNGTLYAFLSIDPSPSRLVIVDLSNPAAPRQVLSQVMGTPFVHDVFVRDGLLFTALWNDGLTIWDIGGGGKGGTVSRLVQLGTVGTVGGEVHNVWWLHDPTTGAKRYALVGQEGPGSIGSRSAGDLHVVDVADLANPREVAFYRVPGAGTHNFAVDEARGVLYAAYYNAGVRALDVRGDLGACTAAQKASDGRCDLALMGRQLAVGLTDQSPVYVWGVAYSGAFVYASDMLNGLWKLAPVAR